MNVLEVQGLCKAYPGFRLEDVSFRLEPGTITGFIANDVIGLGGCVIAINILPRTRHCRLIFLQQLKLLNLNVLGIDAKSNR